MILPFHFVEATMNVLIVDDEPLARAGMRMLLEEEAAITSIAEARNGAEAVAMIRARPARTCCCSTCRCRRWTVSACSRSSAPSTCRR